MTKKSDSGKVALITVKDPKFADTEFFDDCPICRELKKAKENGRELSEAELRKLFEEANKQQGTQ